MENTFLTRTATILGSLILLHNTVLGPITPIHAAEDKGQKQEEKLGLEQLTDAQITQYMAMASVQDILEPYIQSGRILDIPITTSNLEQALAQLYKETFEADQAKYDGVLWFVCADYFSKTEPHKRSAIIYAKLAEEYCKRRIKFIIVNDMSKTDDEGYMQVAINNTLNRTFYSWGMNSFSQQYPLGIVQGYPTMMLFSRWDLLKGETPTRNDGKIKQTDALNGGPDANWRILGTKEEVGWLPYCVEWVSTNLTQNNGKWVWKTYNTAKEQKVFYNQ